MDVQRILDVRGHRFPTFKDSQLFQGDPGSDGARAVRGFKQQVRMSNSVETSIPAPIAVCFFPISAHHVLRPSSQWCRLERTTNGNIYQLVKAQREVNRLELVRPHCGFYDPCLSLTIVICVVGRGGRWPALYAWSRMVHRDLEGVGLLCSTPLSISNTLAKDRT